MNPTAFLCLILALSTGWMQLYSATRELYNGVRDYKAELERLKKRNADDRINLALEHESFIEFRQNVAALMPEAVNKKGLGEEGYPYRNLASTISRNEAEQVRKAIAKTMFERGRTYFRGKNYAKSESVFQQIIKHYSFTPYVAESYFLLSESHFQQNELEQCATAVQQMVELFPHHELTGFAMIRLGRVYEMQNRTEEAIEIYRTVLRAYPQRDVASQARASLKGMDL